jgi:transcriptional regulator with XRE-family HTH domain
MATKKAAGLSRSNRVPKTATLELLIRERNKGKSLRQLGQMFGVSHERVRQILAKHSPSLVTFLAESTVAVKLGYPATWLIKLRKKGIINPTKPGSHWLYSEEQVRQIPSLIAEMRRCERCGELRPKGYQRFCRECSQYVKKHHYKNLSQEEKAKHRERSLAWRKANPEKWKKISSRAQRKYAKSVSYLDTKNPNI